MKALTWLTVSSFALSLVAAAPAALAADKVDKADATAMRKLAQANLAEIEAGKMAAAKAQSEDVKKFGQQMVDDHGKMLEDLKKLADAKGVRLPAEPPAKEKAAMKKLEGLSGEQFDARYMAHMVDDHRKDVKETADIAKKAKDADFKAAVEQAHGKIQEHLQMAQDIAKKEGASRGSSAKR